MLDTLVKIYGVIYLKNASVLVYSTVQRNKHIHFPLFDKQDRGLQVSVW